MVICISLVSASVTCSHKKQRSVLFLVQFDNHLIFTNQMRQKEQKNFGTFALNRIPFGSATIIQPSLQPGASHLFEMPPTVNTGTFIEKAAMGVNSVEPNTMSAQISSEIMGTFSLSAAFAICTGTNTVLAMSHTSKLPEAKSSCRNYKILISHQKILD